MERIGSDNLYHVPLNVFIIVGGDSNHITMPLPGKGVERMGITTPPHTDADDREDRAKEAQEADTLPSWRLIDPINDEDSRHYVRADEMPTICDHDVEDDEPDE